MIISDFRFARAQSDVSTQRGLKENHFYYPGKKYSAGDPTQDYVSLALMLMALEMGLKNYEGKMTSREKKKENIRLFIECKDYNHEVRKMMRFVLKNEHEKITAELLKWITTQMKPKEIILKTAKANKLRL